MQTALVLGIIALAAVFVIRRLVRTFSSDAPQCGCGCSGCSGKPASGSRDDGCQGCSDS